MHPCRVDKTGKVVSDWISLKNYIEGLRKNVFNDDGITLTERSKKFGELDDFSKGLLIAYEMILDSMLEIESWMKNQSTIDETDNNELRKIIVNIGAFEDLKNALEQWYGVKLESFNWESLDLAEEKR